jgi:16S rRNA (cytidine1402-2'-O)-methyltransferase
MSYHIFNEHKQVDQIIHRLNEGETMALISDAGTPAISDPGFLLVRQCLDHNVKIECLPGATAFVPALVKSGLPTDSFVFEGFLPHKKGRKTKLEKLGLEDRTIVLYESPHRLLKALDQLIEQFGEDHQASVSRELTKIHEETVNGSLAEIKAHYSEKKIKGEIVIVIAGKKL